MEDTKWAPASNEMQPMGGGGLFVVQRTGEQIHMQDYTKHSAKGTQANIPNAQSTSICLYFEKQLQADSSW